MIICAGYGGGMFSRGPVLELELSRIKEQFIDCAMHHSTFINKPELEHRDRINIEKLAALYHAYRHDTGLTKIEAAGNKIIIPNIEDWRSKAPLERYEVVSRERALCQAGVLDQFINMNGLKIPGENRIDVGAGSGMFFDYMNFQEREGGTGKKWFGIDVPDEPRAKLINGTYMDRRGIGPEFREYPLGGELPFGNMKFGLATIFYTLHHVDKESLNPGNQQSLLHQLYARMENGGYLFVLEDHIGEYKSDIFKHAYIKEQDRVFYPNSPGEQRTMHSWSMLLEAHGFKVQMHGDAALYNSIGIRTMDAIILAKK